MHPPVQCCFQNRIILFIVGNQPSATLWINQLREILKSLCVLLDVRWCQRPQGNKRRGLDWFRLELRSKAVKLRSSPFQSNVGGQTN